MVRPGYIICDGFTSKVCPLYTKDEACASAVGSGIVSPGACTWENPTWKTWPPAVTSVAGATARAAALGKSIVVVGEEKCNESSSKDWPCATMVVGAAPGVNVSEPMTTSLGRRTIGRSPIVSDFVDAGGWLTIRGIVVPGDTI